MENQFAIETRLTRNDMQNQTTRTWIATTTLFAAFAGCAIEPGDGELDDKGIESELPDDAKLDTLASPTDHGALAFGVRVEAVNDATHLFNIWTFDLAATTTVDIRTDLPADGLDDSVLYLYRFNATTGSWGPFIARNDDVSRGVLWSRLERTLAAGRYRVLVKSFANGDHGRFGLRADRSGGAATTVPVFGITNFMANTIDFLDMNGAVLKTAPVSGDGAHGIAFGDGTYVTASSGGGFGAGPVSGRQISFVGRNGETARAPIASPQTVTENVFYGDGTFLVTRWDRSVLLVDRTGAVINARVPLDAIGAAFGDGVFVVVSHEGTAGIIDKRGNILRSNIQVGTGVRNVAFGEGVFVITSGGDDSVTIIDRTGQILVSGAAVGDSPRGVVYGDGIFMVSNVLGRSVSFIDRTGARVRPDVALGKLPKDIGFGNGIFVVTNFDEDTVTYLDRTGAVRGHFPLRRGANGRAAPVAVAFGELVR